MWSTVCSRTLSQKFGSPKTWSATPRKRLGKFQRKFVLWRRALPVAVGQHVAHHPALGRQVFLQRSFLRVFAWSLASSRLAHCTTSHAATLATCLVLPKQRLFSLSQLWFCGQVRWLGAAWEAERRRGTARMTSGRQRSTVVFFFVLFCGFLVGVVGCGWESSLTVCRRRSSAMEDWLSGLSLGVEAAVDGGAPVRSRLASLFQGTCRMPRTRAALFFRRFLAAWRNQFGGFFLTGPLQRR